MIANINGLVAPHLRTIALLNSRPEEFILTGSRFFSSKEVNPAIDYDFFVLANGEDTISALDNIGFWVNRCPGYNDLKRSGATVYTRSHEYPMNGVRFKVNVDVQVYVDAELFDAKEKAQKAIYNWVPDFMKLTKGERSDIWKQYIIQALMGQWGPL